jgi:hypothetical protein
MADYIRPTPRNPILGLLADAMMGGLSYMEDPRRTQQMQGVGGLLSDTGIAQTIERLAYGEPLTKGTGFATRMKPETANAVMTLGPEAVPIGRAAMAGARAAERGAMAVGRAGERYAERVVPQIMERGGLPAEMVAAMGQGTQSPLTVFHGSPYRFSRFDPTKIGSGEGAQAYGYGHYVAESPDVARRYQMGLTQAKGEEVLYKNRPLGDLYSQIENRSMRLSGNAADIENQKLQLIEHMMLDKSPQELISYAKETGFNPSVINWLTNDVAKNTKIPGALYSIDLPDPAVARMLDWDKKIKEQPIEIQQAISPLVESAAKAYPYIRESQSMTGAGLVNAYRGYRGGNAQATSEALRQQGIPGIRYLDEGSRGAGQGTSNFVVFPGEEDLLRILSVNGGLLTP